MPLRPVYSLSHCLVLSQGTTTIPHVECYDGDTLEWYDAAPMNLNRSALSACVIAGLPNARAFSYLAKAVPAAGADQAHHS